MTNTVRNQQESIQTGISFICFVKKLCKQESVLYILCGGGKEGRGGMERYHPTRLTYHLPPFLLATYHLLYFNLFVG